MASQFVSDDDATDDDAAAAASEDEDAADADDDASSDEDDAPEFDVKAELEALRDGTMSKRDFEAFQQGITRQLGQVKTLQSAVAKLSKNPTVDPNSASADSELLAAIAAALPSVLDTSDPAYSAIQAAQTKRARAEATRDAIAALRENADDDTPAGDDGTGNGMSPEDQAAWNAASSLVNGYARGKGVDPTKLEKAVWDKAVAGSMGIPDRAAELMYEVIDDLATSDSGQQSDRARRKAAGSAGAPGQSGSGSNTGLTVAKLKAMTPEQIMALPPEEVDKLMAQA